MRAPPEDRATLVRRANALSGLSLGEIAAAFGEVPPPDLRRNKGWIGTLIERELGAPSNNDAGPDFADLAVELKTIPVDANGRPTSSTWVCVADPDVHAVWEQSLTWAKLATVLWVPVVGKGPPAERTVGTPMLWSPSSSQVAVIRADWEAHVETLALGELWRVSAREGTALQLRPKGLKGADTHWVVGEEGEWVRAQPKGFYLRRSFTRSLFETG